MVCEIVKYKNCEYEKKMFGALTAWGESVNRLDLLEQNFGSIMNSIVSDTDKIDLDKQYQLMFIVLMNNTFYYSSFNEGRGMAKWKNQTFISLLASKNLTISGTIGISEYRVSQIKKISIKVSDEIRSERQFDIYINDKNPKNA